MYRFGNYYDDETWADMVAEARAEEEDAEFARYCEENDIDPEDDNARDGFRDWKAEGDDPYASRGLRRSDFY